jgi:RNA polymerase sigma-70 factor (ECF subfamily)
MDTAADGGADLLEGLARGDEGALAALFDRYREDLRREVARGLAADPRLAARFDASDVVQEVFLDARRQVAGFLACGGRIDFWVWLRGLARERRLKFLRDHLDAQCRTAKRQQPLPDESWRHPPAPAQSPSAAARVAEQAEGVLRALRRLRPEDQEVIRLRVTEGRTNPEVAALLGVTPAAVAKRLERALRRLREEIRADGCDGGSCDDGGVV